MALSPGEREKTGSSPGSPVEPQPLRAERDKSDRESQLKRAEYERMESWLDTHSAFAHDYFARKATRSMIDGWYIARAVSQSTKPPVAESPHSPNSSSGSNTPVRKVSASEFEVQGTGGSLGRMVQTVDGSPSFLGTPSHLLNQGKSSPTRSRKSINELKQLDDRAVLIELVKDIANELELSILCHKILQNVLILTKADRGSLFLVHGKGTEKCCLATKLFDVTIQSTVEQTREEIRVPWRKGIVGYVAETGETVNIANAYETLPRQSPTYQSLQSQRRLQHKNGLRCHQRDISAMSQRHLSNVSTTFRRPRANYQPNHCDCPETSRRRRCDCLNRLGDVAVTA